MKVKRILVLLQFSARKVDALVVKLKHGARVLAVGRDLVGLLLVEPETDVLDHATDDLKLTMITF